MEFLEKADFEKKTAGDKKACKTRRGKVYECTTHSLFVYGCTEMYCCSKIRTNSNYEHSVFVFYNG